MGMTAPGITASGADPAAFLVTADASEAAGVDREVDEARAREYALLASLLLRAPDADALRALSAIKGSASPLGIAHLQLAEAAAATKVDLVQREFFDLFIGVGRGELVPYASYYLTGFLQDRPLVRLRDDLRRFGLERAEGVYEPEDHVGTLCEIMSGFASGAFEAIPEDQRQFFRAHLEPWAARFFTDLEIAQSAGFYRTVGALGRLFMTIEAEAFTMDE